MWRSLIIAVVGAISLVAAGTAVASSVTNAGDDLRTGWYSDEAQLSPDLVGGNTFGQLWSAHVDGQVYAQPLLSTATATLVVATENNEVYGLNPTTGAQKWAAPFPGTPWDPGDLGCGDLVPSIGTTATPVIDNSTNTVYVTHKRYASGTSGPAAWYMDALDVATGQERAGFPVQLSGSADNDSSLSFSATSQQQRPGLLLMNGVVYAGFGSHCDYSPYRGWVFGVSTTTHAITARWVDNVSNGDGGGIWQAGAGLTSDGSGSILLATGNGGAPTAAAPGSSPPATCGECVIRLHVQSNGSLKPVDFFAPYDATNLDGYDADFGSGAVVGLPDASFGTSTTPHLALAAGKEGVVYLLNRDNLGGYQQGAGGGDKVVQRVGPDGPVFGRPGIWPGDGGYVYVPTSGTGGGVVDVYQYGVSGSGDPTLSPAGSSSEPLGFGSGAPVITSDGTTPGSALVWIIYAADRAGDAGQLRAYDAVPQNGQLMLRFSASIGLATNYGTPGVGDGRLYVGTRDGTVLAFGSPVTQPLSGSSLTFPATTVGDTSQKTLTLTANENLTVTNVASTSSRFSTGTTTPALGTTLTTGQTFSVPVTFSPTQPGSIGGQITVTTSAGTESFAVTGTALSTSPQLAVNPPIVSFGGTYVGREINSAATFSNIGNSPLTITAVHSPQAPFAATGTPQPGDMIGPGKSITVAVSFAPTQTGQFNDQIGLDTTGGNLAIGLSGSAGTPGLLRISTETNDYGSVTVGTTAAKTFTITNAGGTAVTIMKSKPPFGGDYTATTSLEEGTTIAPGATVTESVTFAPTSTAQSTGTWLITGDDGTGLHTVQFTGSGATTPAPSAPPAATPQQPTPGPPIIVPAHVPVLVAPKVVPNVASAGRLASLYVVYTAAVARASRFTLERELTGRRAGRGGRDCIRATARNRRRARCTYFVQVATFSHIDSVGAIRFALTRFVSSRRLVPGTYRLRSVSVDAAGKRHTFATTFRVTR